MKAILCGLIILFNLYTANGFSQFPAKLPAKGTFKREPIKLLAPHWSGIDADATVKIWVDKSGTVINAEIDSSRTTSFDETFIQGCLTAARKSKYAPIVADTIYRTIIKYHVTHYERDLTNHK
jgi:hypothetical protein